MSDPDHVEFERRVVPDDAEHEDAFWGSYTYDDETGRVHTVERMFTVYADPERRENDNPVVAIEETHLVAEAPEEETRAGDADQIDKTTHQEVIDVDPDHEEASVMDWCKDWHESHLDRPSA